MCSEALQMTGVFRCMPTLLMRIIFRGPRLESPLIRLFLPHKLPTFTFKQQPALSMQQPPRALNPQIKYKDLLGSLKQTSAVLVPANISTCDLSKSKLQGCQYLQLILASSLGAIGSDTLRFAVLRLRRFILVSLVVQETNYLHQHAYTFMLVSFDLLHARTQHQCSFTAAAMKHSISNVPITQQS